MKKEKSCGAIVYKIENETILYLLIRSKKGLHYSYPKGHVENDETEVETALREIKEETDLDVALDTNFREVISYSPFEGVMKDVVYFVGEDRFNQHYTIQKEEVKSARWVVFEEAVKLVTHLNELNVLIHANDYIINKHNKKDAI